MKITLYNGDCLEKMRDIPDGSVDAVITDLPYGTTACKWDSIIPMGELWNQFHRVSREDTPCILFGSEPFSTMMRMSNIKEFRYDWIWEKNTSGSFAVAKKMPLKTHEIISVFYRRLPKYNPQMTEYMDSTKKRFKEGQFVNRSRQLAKSTNQITGGLSFEGSPISFTRGSFPKSVLHYKSPPNCLGRFHPTQKPVALIEYLIRTYTNEGETVLDATMGSGTTGVACVNTNRNFIGIEKNDRYFAVAKKRIEAANNAQKQQELSL